MASSAVRASSTRPWCQHWMPHTDRPNSCSAGSSELCGQRAEPLGDRLGRGEVAGRVGHAPQRPGQLVLDVLAAELAGQVLPALEQLGDAAPPLQRAPHRRQPADGVQLGGGVLVPAAGGPAQLRRAGQQVLCRAQREAADRHLRGVLERRRGPGADAERHRGVQVLGEQLGVVVAPGAGLKGVRDLQVQRAADGGRTGPRRRPRGRARARSAGRRSRRRPRPAGAR